MEDFKRAIRDLHSIISPEQDVVLVAAQRRNEGFRHHDALVSLNGTYPVAHVTGCQDLFATATKKGDLKEDARLDASFYEALLRQPATKWNKLWAHHKKHWADAAPWECRCYEILARNYITTALRTIQTHLTSDPAPSPARQDALNNYAAALAAMLTDIENKRYKAYEHLPTLAVMLSFLLLDLDNRTGKGKATFNAMFTHFLRGPRSNKTHYVMNIEPRDEAYQNAIGDKPLPNRYLRIGIKLGETVLTEQIQEGNRVVPPSFVVFLKEPEFTTVHFGRDSLLVRRREARDEKHAEHGMLVKVLPVNSRHPPSD